MIITIDGPSASGKSTIASMLAHKIHFFYLNTGMLYRSFAYAALHENLQQETITDAKINAIIARLAYTWDNQACVYFYDKDITPFLDQKEIDTAASRISALPIVRKHIDAWQHVLADHRNSVIDGRDSGSVVFMHAEHKFYVTASDRIRAQRWLSKQRMQGNSFDLSQALELIQSRDRRDTQRPVAPLVVPEGATVIVNDGDDPAAVAEQIREACFSK